MVEHFQDEHIGKQYEHKDELVPRPDIMDREKEEVLDALLKPFEVDGWIGSRSDITNPHNWKGKDKVRVGFVRWVDVKEAEKDV